jgi:hypothetical protein
MILYPIAIQSAPAPGGLGRSRAATRRKKCIASNGSLWLNGYTLRALDYIFVRDASAWPRSPSTATIVAVGVYDNPFESR